MSSTNSTRNDYAERTCDRLKALRKRLGKTQAEMAGLLHISISGYQNYERGDRELPTATATRANDHLGVSARWLLDGVGEMFVSAPEGPELRRIHDVLGLSQPDTCDLNRMQNAIEALVRVAAESGDVRLPDPGRFARACVTLYELAASGTLPPASVRRVWETVA